MKPFGKSSGLATSPLTQRAAERLKLAEASLLGILPSWSRAPVVDTLQALKGIRIVTAATIVVEIDYMRRFEAPRQLMAYIGLVLGEQSTGESVRRSGITKAGTGRVRRALVEVPGPTDIYLGQVN